MRFSSSCSTWFPSNIFGILKNQVPIAEPVSSTTILRQLNLVPYIFPDKTPQNHLEQLSGCMRGWRWITTTARVLGDAAFLALSFGWSPESQIGQIMP